jgi:tRNA A37 threonylcarbamoyladenosine biosynthesis protein TsaE
VPARPPSSAASRADSARAAIQSPGFTLVTTHPGCLPIVHVDLYRPGIPPWSRGSASPSVPSAGIVLIEWGEQARGVVDADHFEVDDRASGGDCRWIRMTAHGRSRR